MIDYWVKVHRNTVTWEWYKDSETFHLFMHLILKANWKDSKYMGRDVLRGQVVVGRKALSAETGISEKAVRTRLKRLENSGEISIKSASKFSIVTIRNYDKYQTQKADEGQQRASKGPAKGQQRATSKEVKKERSKEVKTSLARSLPEDFAVTDDMVRWAREKTSLNGAIERETEKFVDYWRGNGKAKKDWVATWRNWMRNAEDRFQHSGEPSGGKKIR